MSSIQELVNTPVDAIPDISQKVRLTFASHKARPIEWRLKQLRKLYWAVKDNFDAIEAAAKHDRGASAFEVYISESAWVANDIVFVCDNLKKWAKDEPAPDIELMLKVLSPRIRKDPLGAVLIIGTYNFPMQLTLGPLIGAIAAGCTAVIKPSEVSSASAMVIQKIIESSLDPSAYVVVQGGVQETTALLNEKWDKIFYTGGLAVGKIIAKKAAETLTPIVLELGGKNPAIVTKNADIRLAARRLLWGKSFNAGQLCISENYIMVDESVLTTFIAELKVAWAEFWPNGPKASKDFTRISSKRALQRLQKLIEDSDGKVLIGGDSDENELFLAPTVVQVSSPSDSLLADETFGPIITLLPVPDLDTAIRIANEVSITPLGIYPFGTQKEMNRVLDETRSGGATLNDAFYHGAIPTLQFGGVGESGQGSYRGRASFEVFTHRRSVVQTPGWMERLLAVRYPPHTGTGKQKQFAAMSNKKPGFDREGNVHGNILSLVFGMVTDRIGGTALISILLVGGAYLIGLYTNREAGSLVPAGLSGLIRR